jgi:hypothetical protein
MHTRADRLKIFTIPAVSRPLFADCRRSRRIELDPLRPFDCIMEDLSCRHEGAIYVEGKSAVLLEITYLPWP